MAETSNIEWCDSTFNPWEGCQKVGPGCDHCYAEARNARYGGGVAINWGPGAPRRRTSVSNWNKPKLWNSREFFQCESCGTRGEGVRWEDFAPSGGKLDDGYACAACGSRSMEPVRRRVFCASLADVFDNQVPVQWRRDLFDLIEATPNLDWLILTKRIGNARSLYGEAYLDSARPWPANVWIGATVVNQEEADRDIPKLLQVPARVRFLSMEPLLGPVDLERACDIAESTVCRGSWADMDDPYRCASALRNGSVALLDWVILGGESGTGARPMHPAWARKLRDQCGDAGVPFHFKQHGEWVSVSEVPGDGAHHFFKDGATVRRVGKKAAGRLLDGIEHNGFP